MLLLYTRLLDRQNSSSSLQKESHKSELPHVQSTDQKHDRTIQHNVSQHLEQVKTNYSLHRRFVL